MSQPALAAIRFQFWRDALSIIWTGKTADGEERAVPQSPVAVLLADMRRHRPVQRYYLSQMIEARVGLGLFITSLAREESRGVAYSRPRHCLPLLRRPRWKTTSKPIHPSTLPCS
jgi:hypothetical protein